MLRLSRYRSIKEQWLKMNSEPDLPLRTSGTGVRLPETVPDPALSRSAYAATFGNSASALLSAPWSYGSSLSSPAK
jgi:hypothetical protein